jgi:hypothetical protein
VRQHGADQARERPRHRVLPPPALCAGAPFGAARGAAPARRVRGADGARHGPTFTSP